MKQIGNLQKTCVLIRKAEIIRKSGTFSLFDPFPAFPSRSIWEKLCEEASQVLAFEDHRRIIDDVSKEDWTQTAREKRNE